MRATSLFLAIFLCAGPALACTAPPAQEMEIHLAALNAERARAGRTGLVLDTSLSALAQAHACDMSQRGYFSHTTPEGRTMMDRASRAGLRGYCAMGENIAQGQPDVPSVVASWMRSPGHRRNMLGRGFSHVGFGRGPGAYWVQLFAGPC